MEVKLTNRKELLDIIKSSGDEISNLTNNIHYFSYFDVEPTYFIDVYSESLRFVVLLDNKQIIGLIKLAVYENTKDHYSLSYCSIHKNHQGLGLSKLLIKEMFKYLNETLNNKESIYFGKSFGTSEYTPSGYKNIRDQFIKGCYENGIKFLDNKVGYLDFNFEKKRSGFQSRIL